MLQRADDHRGVVGYQVRDGQRLVLELRMHADHPGPVTISKEAAHCDVEVHSGGWRKRAPGRDQGGQGQRSKMVAEQPVGGIAPAAP